MCAVSLCERVRSEAYQRRAVTTPLSFRLLAFSLFRFHSCTPTSVHPQAAGLTLTVARRIILLEPFRKPGEEAQALNRCHRIGQARPVHCTTLYCR